MPKKAEMPTASSGSRSFVFFLLAKKKKCKKKKKTRKPPSFSFFLLLLFLNSIFFLGVFFLFDPVSYKAALYSLTIVRNR